MVGVAARPRPRKRPPAPAPPPECRALGKRIRHLRTERGISQETLAERADIHRTYIGGIEVGIRNPSLKNIAAIARALGVRISALFPD
jgi:transcriptional regulator with XRE-family HTH domain